MFIGTNGIVFDEDGRVLMIRRDDIFTWALPGGSLESGELPIEGAIREVHEETGLKVAVERLSGLYFWNTNQNSLLILSFLCKRLGGELATSEESLQVKYLPLNPLPRMTLSFHRERIKHGLQPESAGVYWGRQYTTLWSRLALGAVMPITHRWINFRRRLKNLPSYQHPPDWQSGAFVIIKDPEGRALWVKRTDYDVWNLPGGRSESQEAPWETAVRETREEAGLEIELTSLTGIYLKPAKDTMIFTFHAEITGGELIKGAESAEFAYFATGSEPSNTLPKHVERVADAESIGGSPVLSIQKGPPGLTLLGFKREQ